MIRLPKKLIVLGSEYTVTQKKLGRHDAGRSNEVGRYILVDTNLKDEVTLETFYHEVVHIMLMHQGLADLLGAKKHEAFAQGLGVALVSLVSENNLPRLRRKSK